MSTATKYGSIEDGHELELELESTTNNHKDESNNGKFCAGYVPLKLVAPVIAVLCAGLVLLGNPASRHALTTTTNGFDEINNKDNLDGTTTTNTSTAALFFLEQLVDHHNLSNSETYSQRYYEKKDYFGGPGSPIFLILGGEDPLEGLLYPFVSDYLAKDFHGYTASLEHRFYGESTPVENPSHDELHQLLRPNQALWDAARFIQHKRQELGCSLDRSSKHYCPAVSVGGSYPGFLSSLMRFHHSDVVDISYASSAPFHLYSHHVDQGAYYEKVTDTADQASPGCADAVRTALLAAQDDIIHSPAGTLLQDVAVKYGICQGSVPHYIKTTELLAQELMLIVATHFANGNMDYYPPGPDQDFVKGCRVFQNPDLATPAAKVAAYLGMADVESDCFDMMTELPPGPYGRVSSSDWSGVGAGPEGYFWDFTSCQLIPECGFSSKSMFPPRRWSLQWVTDHCMRRFDWKPVPQALEREFGFDDQSKVTRLLLTNGIVDGWSIASILQESPASPGVKVVNMVNGAHHSDLSHTGPTEHDTPDVTEAFKRITAIIGEWLDEVRTENMSLK